MTLFHFARGRRMAAMGLLFVAGLPPALAYNTQDVINFQVTGNIVEGSCNVTKPEAVNLGEYYWKDFAVAGGNTANTPVTIAFDNCTAGLSQATVTFSGTPYAEDATYASVIYANQVAAEAGGTTDVGLQLFIRDADHPVSGVALANGASYPVTITDQAGAMTFEARMYSPHGAPTPGAFSSAVTLNVIYN
jgi:type 1 fimbria pilin